jgi:hypothetical protein
MGSELFPDTESYIVAVIEGEERKESLVADESSLAKSQRRSYPFTLYMKSFFLPKRSFCSIATRIRSLACHATHILSK